MSGAYANKNNPLHEVEVLEQLKTNVNNFPTKHCVKRLKHSAWDVVNPAWKWGPYWEKTVPEVWRPAPRERVQVWGEREW